MVVYTVSSRYAVRDGSKIKLFKNFKERKSFKPDFGAESKLFIQVSRLQVKDHVLGQF